MISYSELVERTKNVVRIEITLRGEEGNGSGLVVDDRGTILTCEHVVRPYGLIPDDIKITNLITSFVKFRSAEITFIKFDI